MMGPLMEMLGRRTPLILSGAMGTELERRGVDIGLPLWSANALVHQPDVVLQVLGTPAAQDRDGDIRRLDQSL